MYNKGDIVICLPGFDTTDTTSIKGGAGYEDGKMYEVRDNGSIVWPTIGGRGIHSQALRIATEFEIKAYKEGIRDVSNVLKPEQIINNYSIF